MAGRRVADQAEVGRLLSLNVSSSLSLTSLPRLFSSPRLLLRFYLSFVPTSPVSVSLSPSLSPSPYPSLFPSLSLTFSFSLPRGVYAVNVQAGWTFVWPAAVSYPLLVPSPRAPHLCPSSLFLFGLISSFFFVAPCVAFSLFHCLRVFFSTLRGIE